MSMDDAQVLAAAADYVNWDTCEETRGFVKALLDAGDAASLRPLVCKRLAFGTAGLRAAMGPGLAAMNDLVVLQTCQGLLLHLENTFGAEEAHRRGIVVGYDHRRAGALSSEGFAHVTLSAAVSRGFTAYALAGVVPTPMLAFAVTHLGAAAGIMVTASHNPKEDNGYKVYSHTGAQIVSPEDALIAACILEALAPWAPPMARQELVHHPSLRDVTGDVVAAYGAAVGRLCLRREANEACTEGVCYTAMHGVGAPYVRSAMASFGHLRLVVVPEQEVPDPTFRTVRKPNPEEKGAMDLLLATAERSGCRLALANDPDADRLAVAERRGAAGEGAGFVTFTGDQVGVLLGTYMFERWRRANPDADPSTAAVLCSVVSSGMLAAAAAAEGYRCVRTLTGFKHLGTAALALRARGSEVLFSYEEALGYCCGDVVVDKDGVSAACVFAEMAAESYAAGTSVAGRLAALEERYGVFVSNNSYVLSPDNAVTDAVFERLRDGGAYGPARGLGAGVVRVQDVTLGYDSAGEPELPVTPETHMIMFTFDNGCTATLRTSGTEPKIKYYMEMRGEGGSRREDVAAALATFTEAFVEATLEPSSRGLERP